LIIFLKLEIKPQRE